MEGETERKGWRERVLITTNNFFIVINGKDFSHFTTLSLPFPDTWSQQTTSIYSIKHEIRKARVRGAITMICTLGIWYDGLESLDESQPQMA